MTRPYAQTEKVSIQGDKLQGREADVAEDKFSGSRLLSLSATSRP